MSTKTSHIRLSELEIQTIRKDIKNIHLGVYPPTGRIRVAAPLKTSDEVIRLLILSKLPWIKRQKIKFIKQEREAKREYVSGESHYLLGQRYILTVISDGTIPRIEIKRKDRIDMYVKPGEDRKHKEERLNAFYRTQLKKRISEIIGKLEHRVGVSANEIRIKKMKTKWGTANHDDSRIWINLELAKKPLHCLEYVLLHELIHLIEKKHTKKFRVLMDTYMPHWQQYKDELNASLLGYNTWENCSISISPS